MAGETPAPGAGNGQPAPNGTGADNAGQGAGNGGQGAGNGKPGEGEGQNGVLVKDGVEYIPKASYEVVAGKYRDAKTKLDGYDADAKKHEEEELKKRGEFEKLAQQKEQEANDLKLKYETEKRSNALQVAALQAGAVDTDAVVKLADISKIKLSDEGSIDQESVKALVEELKTGKPYLFGAQGAPAPKPNMGTGGGAPAGGGSANVPTFNRSQLRDHAFYKAHEAEILAAAAAGKIVNDIA